MARVGDWRQRGLHASETDAVRRDEDGWSCLSTDCDQRFDQIDELRAHLYACPKRRVACAICHRRVMQQDMDIHLAQCNPNRKDHGYGVNPADCVLGAFVVCLILMVAFIAHESIMARQRTSSLKTATPSHDPIKRPSAAPSVPAATTASTPTPKLKVDKKRVDGLLHELNHQVDSNIGGSKHVKEKGHEQVKLLLAEMMRVQADMSRIQQRASRIGLTDTKVTSASELTEIGRPVKTLKHTLCPGLTSEGHCIWDATVGVYTHHTIDEGINSILVRDDAVLRYLDVKGNKSLALISQGRFFAFNSLNLNDLLAAPTLFGEWLDVLEVLDWHRNVKRVRLDFNQAANGALEVKYLGWDGSKNLMIIA